MNKCKFALLSASLVFAITFTLSCTSDDPDDNPGSGSGVVPSTNANGDQTYKVEGPQVYILGLPSRPYTDNATLVGTKCNSGTVGRIENGKLFLDLPSIEDPDIFNEDGICDEEFAINDFLHIELIGTTKRLTQTTAKEDLKAAAGFIYSSRSGEFSDPNNPGIKFNLKKGWNILYILMADRSISVTQPSGLTWEWGLND